MDIRDWPLNRIMQLPDHCFGRRWPVCVESHTEGIGTYYDISEAGLPEKCVIWEVFTASFGASTSEIVVSVALGDVVPTTDAEFDALENPLRDLGARFGGRRIWDMHGYGPRFGLRMRLPIETGGRRLVGRFLVSAAGCHFPIFAIVVSSIPMEVPDCLLSGHL